MCWVYPRPWVWKMSQKAEELTGKWSRWTDDQDVMIQHGKHHRIQNQKRTLQLYPRQGEEGFSEKVNVVVKSWQMRGRRKGLRRSHWEGKIHSGDYKSLIMRYDLEIDKQETREVGRAVPSSKGGLFSTLILDPAVTGPCKIPKLRTNMSGFALKKVVGLPCWLSGKESTCQGRRHRFTPWCRKILHAM